MQLLPTGAAGTFTRFGFNGMNAMGPAVGLLFPRTKVEAERGKVFSRPAQYINNIVRYLSQSFLHFRSASGILGLMKTTHIVRRSHLYLGLILAPWVLFFGVSALTIHFEEPMSGWPERTGFEDPAIETSLVARLPDPEAIAQRTLRALTADGDGSGYHMTGNKPAYDGVVTAAVNWSTANGKVAIFPNTLEGVITKFRPAVPQQKISGLIAPMIDQAELEELDRQVDAVVRTKDGTVQKVGKAVLPAVKFYVIRDSQPMVVTCNITTGDVWLSAVPDLPPASFLMKLHKDYKSGPDAPWFQRVWHLMAIMVACALGVWMITGLIMWFQLKSLRTSGLVVLALSGILFVAVLSGMWHQFTL